MRSCSVASVSSSSTGTAAWATMAGWVRMVGHVTYVISGMREVACAAAPRTLQAYGEWPCASSHGK